MVHQHPEMRPVMLINQEGKNCNPRKVMKTGKVGQNIRENLLVETTIWELSCVLRCKGSDLVCLDSLAHSTGKCGYSNISRFQGDFLWNI